MAKLLLCPEDYARAQSFLMGYHERLGEFSRVRMLPLEITQKIVSFATEGAYVLMETMPKAVAPTKIEFADVCEDSFVLAEVYDSHFECQQSGHAEDITAVALSNDLLVTGLADGRKAIAPTEIKFAD